MGGMVGSLSHQVLGGFDVGLPPGVQRGPCFVVPNVESLAGAHDLDHRQVRLWVAMLETTHVAAMAEPWVRQHVVDSMSAFVASLEIDAEAMQSRMELLQDPESLQRLADEGGPALPPLLAARGGAQELEDVRTLMSIAEGYAEFLVDRCVRDLIPQVTALRTAIDRRRAEPSPAPQMLTQMIGLDLDHAGYRRGAIFCHEVARRWGDDAVHRLWESQATLPRSGDLEDPVAWAARALLSRES
jgi:putative hydrolase